MQTVKQLNRGSHFILTCTIARGGGGEGVAAAEVRVDPAPPPMVTLSASPPEVVINGQPLYAGQVHIPTAAS
jgi:hypothetical protein